MTDRSQTDLSRSGIAARLLSSMGMLAHSVAIQAVATVAVTVALATVPWLPHPAATLPPAAAPAETALQATSAAMPPLDPLSLSGISPLGAFPMEGEAHFATSLSRPFVALASAEWRDDGPAAANQPSGAASRHKPSAAQACEDCAAPALLQQASYVLPPPRPADLADSAILRRATTVPAQAAAAPPPPASTPAGRLVDIGLPALPTLPSLPSLPGITQVTTQIDQARDVLGHTVSVATDSVTGILKAF